MKLVKVSSMFDVVYGVNLELNKMTLDPNGINFVSRSARNNGVSARVKKMDGIKPIPAGVLTVAGGGSVMETFVQPEPFYSGRDLYYLVPKEELTLQEKLFYCMCLRANKYRFNYGRQANRTLKDIKIPARSAIPSWATTTFESVLKDWGGKIGGLATESGVQLPQDMGTASSDKTAK